jgi:cysteinyl-tRNA synthetase
MMTSETASSRKVPRHHLGVVGIGLILLPALAACGTPRGLAGSVQAAVPVHASQQVEAERLRSVQHWLYQLQNLDVGRASASGFDLIVTDYSADGSDARRFTPEQVARMQAGRPQGRLVLAYMSIGEAEDYRFYWRQDWRPGNPAWLLPVNPEWSGNYPVEYWQPEWKRILYGSPEAYLDKIIDAGYDGVYLDIIDAYEHFEASRPSARREMVELVSEIASYARETRGKSQFGVFPQNGEALADEPGYLDTITGIGREDIYYGNPTEGQASPGGFTAELERHLDRYVAAGKLVLTVDYTRRPEQIADAYQRARQRGYVPYVTVRDLNRMTINRGYDPE